MRPFEYVQVADVDDAVQALAERGAVALGGGTNLVDLMRRGVAHPDALVDISRLPLTEIEELADGGIRIGALVRNSSLAADPLVRQRYPMLARALLAGASAQVRNMATVGGNLLQRTRCLYFVDVSAACNKREPGTGCSALDGFNRNTAVLGTSDQCIAAHPSDMAVALVALDAVVEVRSVRGVRRLPLTELHRLPGDAPHRDTTLEDDELIVAVELPRPASEHSTYRKVRDRASFAFALVSVAAALDVSDGTITVARVALGGVAPKPWRAREAERVLVGAPATEETFRAAAEAELAGAQGRGENAFKSELARRTIAATLSALAATAGAA
ncbi:MAG TPA: xanthine dehydrogenase family protein subunit M [Diaminobutyricibacter sp.]